MTPPAPASNDVTGAGSRAGRADAERKPFRCRVNDGVGSGGGSGGRETLVARRAEQ